MSSVSPGPIDGSVRAPASKSVAQRALICASLADGTSTIELGAGCADIDATAAACEALDRRRHGGKLRLELRPGPHAGIRMVLVRVCSRRRWHSCAPRSCGLPPALGGEKTRRKSDGGC